MPSYDTPDSIARLLDTTASDITWLHQFTSKEYQIPHDSRITIPIPCQCSGSIYQHNTRYTVEASDTYFGIANNTYQGLTTCQAIDGQNFYDDGVVPIGTELMVPVRCACLTGTQSLNGVIALIVYMVESGDTVHSIANAFGVRIESLLEANELIENSTIFPFTPLLVPLDNECCQVNPRFYFCSRPCASYNCRSPRLFVTLIVEDEVEEVVLLDRE